MPEKRILAVPDRYIDTAEAAEYLHVSPKTIPNLVADGVVKHERVGRNGRWLRFKLGWLDEAATAWRTRNGSAKLHFR